MILGLHIRFMRGKKILPAIRHLFVFALTFGFMTQVVMAQAFTIIRVSTKTDGSQVTSNSSFANVSSDGRYVVFLSADSTFVAGDTNSTVDIFRKDTTTGVTELVSANALGVISNNYSENPVISDDGRYVAFASYGDNLVAGDTNLNQDIFRKDMQTGAIIRVSTSSAGVEANDYNEFTYSPSSAMSSDGRYIVWDSGATNLVAGDTNAAYDVFLKDTQTGTTEIISSNSSGTIGNAGSDTANMSSDGRYVVFRSASTNLVAGDTNGQPDVFMKDRQTGATTIISTDSAGVQANNSSTYASVDQTGNLVVFVSSATNLVASDTNASRDVFVKNISTGVLTRVSTSALGVQSINGAGTDSFISRDGKYVVFQSYSSNLTANPTFVKTNVFIKQLSTGDIQMLSRAPNGDGSNDSATELVHISANSQYVAFTSYATNLIASDNNSRNDVFLVTNPFWDPPVAAPAPIVVAQKTGTLANTGLNSSVIALLSFVLIALGSVFIFRKRLV